MCQKLKVIFDCDHEWEPYGCRILCISGPCQDPTYNKFVVPFPCWGCLQELEHKWDDRIQACNEALSTAAAIATRVYPSALTIDHELSLHLERDRLVLGLEAECGPIVRGHGRLAGMLNCYRDELHRRYPGSDEEDVPPRPRTWSEARGGGQCAAAEASPEPWAVGIYTADDSPTSDPRGLGTCGHSQRRRPDVLIESDPNGSVSDAGAEYSRRRLRDLALGHTPSPMNIDFPGADAFRSSPDLVNLNSVAAPSSSPRPPSSLQSFGEGMYDDDYP